MKKKNDQHGCASTVETNTEVDRSPKSRIYVLAISPRATYVNCRSLSLTSATLDIENMSKNQIQKVSISVPQLIDLIHAARRYADFRCTYAPSEFNRLYDALIAEYPFLSELDLMDETLMGRGKYFPYAQDGNFCPDTGAFDARPRHITNKL